MNAGNGWGLVGLTFAVAGLIVYGACLLDDHMTRQGDRRQDDREGWEPPSNLDRMDGQGDPWL